ncbi:MAG: hypothetical protein ACRDZ5_02685, partial [Acidimicrobiales bacterium]
VEGARFASLLEPPESLAQAARSCVNDGSFPVLASRDDDVVLCSPIILYDHPDIAPESPGDLYDSTEIDEILALRVLTLTDDEKAEARATDPRAAAVIDRCDAMTPEVWGGLHGAVRSLRRLDEAPEAPFWDPAHDASHDPESDAAYIGGVAVKKGSKVRLVPSRGGDAQDFFVAGRTATVAAVMTDLEGSQHVAVTVDDDPATAELVWQGRYLYFHPEEVLPLLGGEGDPQ